MTEHGTRTRAGKLLTAFIREIAEEKTEVLLGAEDKMVTKAEALARLIWKKALGYKEVNIVKGQPLDIIYHPDKGCMGLIFDRMEGKAPASLDEGDDKMTVAERVSEQGVKRINKISE